MLTYDDAHADTMDCEGCGKRLPSEKSLLNVMAWECDAERALLGAYRRDANGKYLGKLACFDSACADCRLFASAKVTAKIALHSGMIYAIPPFGAYHFDLAKANGDAARAYFDIRDADGKRFVIRFADIIDAKKSQRGTKPLVTCYVRIP